MFARIYKKIKYRYIDASEVNHNEATPLAYSFYNRKIIINDNIVEKLYNNIKNEYCHYYNNVYSAFAANSFICFALLHEVGHASQYKKCHDNNNLENLLLQLCFYGTNCFCNQGRFDIFMGKMGYFRNFEVFSNLILIGDINRKYSSISPYERMANIGANLELQKILSSSNDNRFAGYLDSLNKSLTKYYLNGYDFNQSITSPTNRYINDFTQLGILGDNSSLLNQINNKIEKQKSKSLTKRLYLGIDINRDEYNLEKEKINKPV